MALADTARLIASLELDPRKFTKGLSAADKALGRTEGRAFKAGQQIGTGIKNAAKIAAVGVGILATNVALGLDSLIKLEQQEAQTNAVIKSTGGIAKVTAEDVGQLAEEFENMNATIGDEVIRSAENMLLTFTNIRKKAFKPTLQAVLDMNTAMGNGPEGLTKTAIQVGKALNDPTKGITALRKAGVTFTAAQVKKIKSLQEEGKLYEAQQIVLKELNKEFGGSFLAQGDTTAGSVAKFTDAIEDLQRALATALLPTVRNVADSLGKLLSDPKVLTDARTLGAQIGKLFSPQNIDKGIDAIKSGFKIAKEAAPVIAEAAKITGAALKIAVDAFKSLPPDIQKLAIAGLALNKLTGGLVTNIAGGLISAVLKQLVSGVVNVAGGVVNVTGPGGLPGAPVPGAPTPPGTPGISVPRIGAAVVIDKGWLFGEVVKTRTAIVEVGNKATAAAALSDSRDSIQTEKQVKRQIEIANRIRTAAAEEQRRGERLVTSAAQTKASIDASKARLAAVMTETKRETTRGAAATAAAARNAGERARSASLAAAAAIRAKDLSIKVTNINNVRLSIRDVSTKMSFNQTMKVYG